MEVKVTRRFVGLATVYASMLLISNVLSNKVIMPFGIVLPCAAILFPVTYILSDLMTEIYGIVPSKRCIRMNAILNLFMSLIFIVATKIPAAPFYELSDSFNAILGNTWRIVVSSLIAYYLGDMVNSYSLSFLKAKLNGKKIVGNEFFRSIASSILGQIFDTVLFIVMAFYGTMPGEMLLSMIMWQYLFKILYQVAAWYIIPIMPFLIKWWKKVEGIDVTDKW